SGLGLDLRLSKIKRTNVALLGFESRYVEYLTPFCYLTFSSFFSELSFSSAQIKQLKNDIKSLVKKDNDSFRNNLTDFKNFTSGYGT
ncbi:hypothetical protein BpHYR1_019931, partial [Brachionus plicatilis]